LDCGSGGPDGSAARRRASRARGRTSKRWARSLISRSGIRGVSRAQRNASLKGVYSISPRRRASTPLCLRGLSASGALQTPISGLPEIGAQNPSRSGKPDPAWIVAHTAFAKVPGLRRTASLPLALHRIRDTRGLILAPMGQSPGMTHMVKGDALRSLDTSTPPPPSSPPRRSALPDGAGRGCGGPGSRRCRR
jgi:hypothetical protein